MPRHMDLNGRSNLCERVAPYAAVTPFHIPSQVVTTVW